MTNPADPAAPEWTVRLISELKAADSRAIAVANALTPQQLNWKPGPAQWSVGQWFGALVAGERGIPGCDVTRAGGWAPCRRPGNHARLVRSVFHSPLPRTLHQDATRPRAAEDQAKS